MTYSSNYLYLSYSFSLWFVCPFSSYLFIIYSISLTLVLKDFLLTFDFHFGIFIFYSFPHNPIFINYVCGFFKSMSSYFFYIQSLFLMGTLLCHWWCRLNCPHCLSSWLFFNKSFSGLYIHLIFKVLFLFLVTWCFSKGWFIFIYSFIFM